MSRRNHFAIALFSFFLIAMVSYFFHKSESLLAPRILVAKNEAFKLYGQDDIARLSKTLNSKGFKDSESFEEMPFIDKAVLIKSLVGPDKIMVYLQEPILAFSTRGVYKLVDKRGDVFSEVPQYKIPNLPIISGQKFEAKKNRELAVEAFLSLKKEGLLSQNSLSEMLINEDLILIFSGVKGRVLIGQGEVPKKLERLSKVVKYLRFHGLEAEALDARFDDRVIVSLNKKPNPKKET